MKIESTLQHFSQENAFENIVCEMVAILSRGRWVKLEAICCTLTGKPFVLNPSSHVYCHNRKKCICEFNARFTPNRDQLRTELRVLDFLDSSAVVKLLSSDRKLALTSVSGSDWHRSKQKLYNWPSNKSDLRLHHDRFAISWPSHAIRKSIGINSGPRATITVRSPWYTCDRLRTDLWCFATD